jgi:hypothetical protein
VFLRSAVDKFMVHGKKGEGERECPWKERRRRKRIIMIRNGAKTISLPSF